MFLEVLLQILYVLLERPNCIIGLGPLVLSDEFFDELLDNLVFLPVTVLLYDDEGEPLPDVLVDRDGRLNCPQPNSPGVTIGALPYKYIYF